MGVPLCEHQSVRAMLADMEVQVEASRQLVLYQCEILDRGMNPRGRGSIAKLYATESAMKVSIDAVQILGAYGYMRDYPVEKLMRDAKVMTILEGASEIQRDTIARSIL